MDDIDLPLVSICIPTYNGESYIVEAMDSAILQTYTNLEIVVSDDASEDNTLAIIESYIGKTKIPISIYHHKPKGIGANWNNSIKHAKGHYIKFLFQDDVLKPNCIGTMMTLALENPDVGLVYCKRDLIYKELTPKIKDFIAYYDNLHTHWDSFLVKEGVKSGKAYLKDRQFLNSPKNKIGEPTNVLLLKSCFESVGWFNEDLKQVLDSDYWYRVMKYYDIGFVDKALVQFRLHNQQTSNLNKGNEIVETSLMYEQYYNYVFWHLHPKNQLKLLKLFHPLFNSLVKLKAKYYDN